CRSRPTSRCCWSTRRSGWTAATWSWAGTWRCSAWTGAGGARIGWPACGAGGSADRLAGLRGGGDRLLPPEADPFFTAERLRGPSAELGAAFSVVVVVGGAGTLAGEHDRLPVRRGDTLLVPYAAGRLTLTGDVEAIRLSAAAAP